MSMSCFFHDYEKGFVLYRNCNRLLLLGEEALDTFLVHYRENERAAEPTLSLAN